MRKITIIGGGLAGLSLGVYLRKLGVDTEIRESGTYPKHKVCGEFICGVKDQTLIDMGLENVITDSIHHRDMSWWMNGSPFMERQLPQVAWGISRYKLDEDLAEQFVKMGGVLSLNHRVKLDGEAEETEEGVVYGVGKRKDTQQKHRWIGLKIHAVDVPDSDIKGLEMHMGERGYMGVCGVEGQRVNCCGLFRIDKSIKGSGIDLILNYLEANGIEKLADKLRAWSVDTESFSATAGFALGGQARVGGFCVGDALHVIPPFTGNGMSMALESSHIAGDWLARYAKEEISWDETLAGYDTECHAFFKKRMSLSRSVHPLFFKPLGRAALKLSAKSGILPFKHLFSQLRTP